MIRTQLYVPLKFNLHNTIPLFRTKPIVIESPRKVTFEHGFELLNNIIQNISTFIRLPLKYGWFAITRPTHFDFVCLFQLFVFNTRI